VKFQRSEQFRREFAQLSDREQRLFLAAVRAINEAWARHRGPGLPPWPAALRMRPMTGRSGIWEMTWSFAGPDGRATFELVEIDGEPAIRWRRIGTHANYGQP